MSGPENTSGGATPAAAADTAAPVPSDAAAVEPEDRRSRLAAAAVGAIMLAFAAVALVDATRMGGGSGPALLGAGAFPALIATLLTGVGGTVLVRSLAALRTAPPAYPWVRGAWVRLAALVGALVAFAVALPVVGFTLSAALLFTAAALLLGAPYPWRTAAYGWTLAALLFLLFDVLIGLSLPGGPWGF